MYKADELYILTNHKGNLVHKCPETKDGVPYKCKDFKLCEYLHGHKEEQLRQRIQKKQELFNKEKARLEHVEKQRLVFYFISRFISRVCDYFSYSSLFVLGRWCLWTGEAEA